MARQYREKVETELRKICNEVLALLNKYLIANARVQGFLPQDEWGLFQVCFSSILNP